jgi:hypothetical protein
MKEIKFYRSAPEPQCCVQPAPQLLDAEDTPAFTLVCLERTNDPDSNNHTGYDYWGVYFTPGEAEEALGQWLGLHGPELEEINVAALPNPITFYPEPFSSLSA